MVRIDVDLDSIQIMGGGNFPIGKHRAKLTGCDEQDSSTGNPMLVWDWEGADDESQGETIRSWTSLLDHALGSFKVHAEAFGYSGEVTVDTDACIGKYATLVVGLRKRRNTSAGDEEERPTVITVLPDEGAAKRGAGPSNGSARRLGGGSKAASPPSSRGVGTKRSASSDDDELPF